MYDDKYGFNEKVKTPKALEYVESLKKHKKTGKMNFIFGKQTGK